MESRVKVLLKNRSFQACLFIILLIIAIGAVGPFFTLNPHRFVGGKYEPPSSRHILGTDNMGRDVWAQLIHGIRYSLIIGFFSGLIGLLIAFAVGGFSGYMGIMAISEMLNLISNTILVIPTVPLLIVLSSLFKTRSLYLIATIIAVTIWPGTARSIRSQILSLKERDFVNLARISGKKSWEIVFKEIFPNMLSYIFISFCSMFGGAIMAEAGISLIGLGPTDIITLGTMFHWAIINYAVTVGAWWCFIPPGIVLISFTGSLIILGSVIDDVLNPKLQGR